MTMLSFSSLRRPLILTLSLVAAFIPLTTSAHSSKRADEPQALSLGVPAERELSSGQVHHYQILLAAGEFLRVVIDQHGIRIAPEVFAPDQTQLTDLPITHVDKDTSSLSLIAGQTGAYRIKIKSAGDEPVKGRYKVEAVEQRPATHEDKSRYDAELAFHEGEKLKARPTLEERQLAIAKLEEAAAYWREIGDRKGESRALTAIGIGYDYGGELQAAMDYYQRAIQLAQSSGNRLGEANLHLSIGRIHFFFGDDQSALDSFNRSAQLYRESSAPYGEALALASIGSAHLTMGELQRALEYHERALPAIISLGDWGNESISRSHIGTILLGMGETEKALEQYNRSLELARKLGNAQLESNTLTKLGNIHMLMGESQKALDAYRKALRLAEAGNYQISEAVLHKSIGNVAFKMGDTEKALQSLTRSLELFRSIRYRAEEANTLYSLARVNYSAGNLAEAREQIEKAIEIKEFLRARVLDQDLRVSSVASLHNSYSLYINLLMRLHQKHPAEGYDARALEASERARARGLLEMLAESGADIREGVSPELLALERSLKRQLNAKAAARMRSRNSALAASFDKEISQLTSRYREVEAQIRATSPRYAALTQPQPLSAAEIQKLLDEDSALLEFSLGEEGSWLWVVTPKAIASYQLPPRAEIEAAGRKVYDLLTARQPKAGLTESQQLARIREADAKFQDVSRELSRTLLGQIADPIRRELKGKRLLIVAPGALEYLPFQALPVPSNDKTYRPLIADHEIVNLPSASVLSVIRRETAGRAAASKSVAVFADPVFDTSDPRLIAAKRKARNQEMAISVRSAGDAPASDESALSRAVRSMSRASLSRLPFSREEAEAIASFVPARALLKAIDFKASRENVLSGQLSNYNILHFATHGLLNSEHPELSGLVLSLVDETGRAQDGFLRMHEIYNLRLPAEVVVLSACQTGLGKQIKGEGLLGLTRGFMYAGARRVVASLWQVDDLATAELMKRFYRGMLKEGLRPAAALRGAQLELMREKRWASPFFWAAFVMQGEWK
ncbi:MAG TPA: CHAT domain-containing protein [Blastocatellia bacterium]|nr:CHAT domain-containing protein [Blastocatellia bacterium]